VTRVCKCGKQNRPRSAGDQKLEFRLQTRVTFS